MKTNIEKRNYKPKMNIQKTNQKDNYRNINKK